ncbi:uncharacterized protein ISCGN_024130 [Ixodes scapularis]
MLRTRVLRAKYTDTDVRCTLCRGLRKRCSTTSPWSARACSRRCRAAMEIIHTLSRALRAIRSHRPLICFRLGGASYRPLQDHNNNNNKRAVSQLAGAREAWNLERVMADSVDIAKARRILNGFSSFELNDLLRQDLPDLIVDHAPKQRPGARQRPTRADAVADAISALQEPQLRLQALASVHCFFLRTRADKMMPWSLFKVSTDATVTDDVLFNNRIFIESVARFLKEECSCDVELRWKLQRGAVYACFLMQDLCEVLHLHAHHAVYLVHCPGLPLLAACVSRTAMFVPLAMALDRALCTFEIKRVKVPHTTLACAFQDALRSVGVSHPQSYLDPFNPDFILGNRKKSESHMA